ncbi:MAG: (Fe-S)-binding protein [Actinomycetota bacterium]|nr:(Fe-S)-binding protein [Actinomycetota bacterium]
MDAPPPLGSELPEGIRFLGREADAVPGWHAGDAPSDADISSCVACGLCLPHCPTYRLTGEESASPRGRIAAMRTVAEGRAELDDSFSTFMDLCLSCRACEDVCPSHVPFGRMMERARAQIEPRRGPAERAVRTIGLDWMLSRNWALTATAALAPLAKPFLPRRMARLVPRAPLRELVRPLPRLTEPRSVKRGTVALLSGCVQDRWYRSVNRATIRVLARNGWRVIVPRDQSCCGALSAHYGHLDASRKLARRNVRSFGRTRDPVDHVVTNAAGCGAHLKEYGELLGGDAAAKHLAHATRDVMELLAEEGFEPPAAGFRGPRRVAYHDACHALRAQGIFRQPREVLGSIPDLELVEIRNGDRCCGAAGLYNVLQPEMSGQLAQDKVEAIAESGAPTVATANPGCAMQLGSALRDSGSRVRVLHPVELLDRAYRASRKENRSKPV